MTAWRGVVAIFVMALLVFWPAACGKGSGDTPPSISVSISNPPTSVVVGATATLAAVVTNDSGCAGVTWTVHCGGTACGTVNPITSTGNSSTTTFTAPPVVPTGNTVTVTATSVADTTKSASVSITITVPTPISVTISNPPTSLPVGASVSLTANVSNDSKAAGVAWTVACSSSTCGSFNPATSPDNTATTTYTAPANVPTGNTVTVTATSVTDNTKSATATITITTPVVADGRYVFRASGDDGNVAYFVAGVFTLSKGTITGGEEDLIDFLQGGEAFIQATGSSLTVATDGNFQLVLATNNSKFGVNGVETFRGALVSPTHAQIDEFDSFAAAQGTLDLQTSTSPPSGGFAFNLGGIDGSANPNPLFIGGIITVSATSINVGSSVFDYYDGGALHQDVSFASGTLSAPDTLGRLTISLNPSQGSGGVPFTVIGYIMSASQIQLIESPSDTLGGTLAGTALGQGANSGTFTAAGVGGHTYVFTAQGEDQLNGMATFAGAFTLNSGGTVSGNLAYNDITSNQNLPISSGNWSVDSVGRVAFTNITIAGSDIANGAPFSFQFYLDGNGNALQLGTDTIEGSAGPAYQQTAAQQIAAGNYVIGAQGFAATQGKPTWAAVGPVTLDGQLNWTGFTDYFVFGETPAANVTLSGTTNTTTTQFSITGLNAVNPPPATPQFAYWQIDSSRLLAIELDTGQSGSFLLEAISQ
jgi:hypothetical protein